MDITLILSRWQTKGQGVQVLSVEKCIDHAIKE
jgi:hypothetical protein